MTEQTGHCLCGATCFAFGPAAVRWQAICHCDSCRRAAGGGIVGWIGVTDGAWRWTGAPPATHASAPGVTRNFCATCGTTLTYASARWPNETHFTAATLTDPTTFHPTFHVHATESLHWTSGHDGLPQFPGTAPD
jgi:hypothetical protein